MKSLIFGILPLLALSSCKPSKEEAAEPSKAEPTKASTPDPEEKAVPSPAVPPSEKPAAKGFHADLSLQGISFTVDCPNAGSLNQLTIKPAGLEIDNSVIEQEIDGTVTNAEIADLNADGSPEIYVFINSAGSGSYASLVAYSTNNKKSLSSIYLPELDPEDDNAKGYMGHDEFAVVENSLVRRFPVYNDGDNNSSPSGKTRQLQYKLTAGEASWKLTLETATEF